MSFWEDIMLIRGLAPLLFLLSLHSLEEGWGILTVTLKMNEFPISRWQMCGLGTAQPNYDNTPHQMGGIKGLFDVLLNWMTVVFLTWRIQMATVHEWMDLLRVNKLLRKKHFASPLWGHLLRFKHCNLSTQWQHLFIDSGCCFDWMNMPSFAASALHLFLCVKDLAGRPRHVTLCLVFNMWGDFDHSQLWLGLRHVITSLEWNYCIWINKIFKVFQ